MALINCPECGRQNVSDTAQACPECGFNIKDYLESKQPSKTESYRKWLEENEPSGILGELKMVQIKKAKESLAKSAVSSLPKKMTGRLLFAGLGSGAVTEALINRTACTIHVIDISENRLKATKKWNLGYVRGGRLSLDCSSLGDYVMSGEKYAVAIVVDPGLYEAPALVFEKLSMILEPDALLFVCISKPASKDDSLEQAKAAAEQAGFQIAEASNVSAGTILKLQQRE